MKKSISHLQTLFSCLLQVTGVDFQSRLADKAKDDRVTELEIKDFLRKNYPGADVPKNLTSEDKVHLDLLMNFYLRKVDEHDIISKDSATKFTCSETPANNYDEPFRSHKGIGHFSKNKNVLQFATGFFPANE